MLESLFDLPLLVAGPAIIGSLCLFALAGLAVVRRRVLPHLRIRAEDSEFTGAMVQAVMVFYGLALSLIWLAATVQGFGAEPVRSLKPVVTTNYVVVTNIIVVTNYVITTNAAPVAASLTAGRTDSLPSDLRWIPPADSFDWIQLRSGE